MNMLFNTSWHGMCELPVNIAAISHLCAYTVGCHEGVIYENLVSTCDLSSSKVILLRTPMADVEYLKNLLGVHPDWPKKVTP